MFVHEKYQPMYIYNRFVILMRLYDCDCDGLIECIIIIIILLNSYFPFIETLYNTGARIFFMYLMFLNYKL